MRIKGSKNGDGVNLTFNHKELHLLGRTDPDSERSMVLDIKRTGDRIFFTLKDGQKRHKRDGHTLKVHKTDHGTLRGYMKIPTSKFDILSRNGSQTEVPLETGLGGLIGFAVPTDWDSLKTVGSGLARITQRPQTPSNGKHAPDLGLLREAVTLINNAIEDGAQIKMKNGRVVLYANVCISS